MCSRHLIHFFFQVANRRTPVCILPTTLCYYSYSKDVNSTVRKMYGDKFSHRLRLTHSSNHNLYDYYLQGNLKQKFTTQITIQLNWWEKVRTKLITVSQEFQSYTVNVNSYTETSGIHAEWRIFPASALKSVHFSKVNIIPFWDIVTCSLTEVDRSFRDAYCLQHQGNDCHPEDGKQYGPEISCM
jgi:hypothetical protein